VVGLSSAARLSQEPDTKSQRTSAARAGVIKGGAGVGQAPPAVQWRVVQQTGVGVRCGCVVI